MLYHALLIIDALNIKNFTISWIYMAFPIKAPAGCGSICLQLLLEDFFYYNFATFGGLLLMGICIRGDMVCRGKFCSSRVPPPDVASSLFCLFFILFVLFCSSLSILFLFHRTRRDKRWRPACRIQNIFCVLLVFFCLKKKDKVTSEGAFYKEGCTHLLYESTAYKKIRIKKFKS